MKVALPLAAALVLTGCLTPAENVAVNVLLPVLIDGAAGNRERQNDSPNPAKDETP